MSNLLMSQPKINPEDQGIMDIGKNCYKCNQLDFLPFHCEFCNHIYCSNHRGLETHECVGRPQAKTAGQKTYDGPSAASLFPDNEKRREKLERSFKEASPTTIEESQKGKNGAMMKLTKFLHLQRLRRSNNNDNKTSLFGRLKQKSSSGRGGGGANKVVETSQIRKSAKGSNGVPASDRVYVWVLFVDGNEEQLGQIDVAKQRQGVWISSKWSMGRALDSIADVMKIINHNNSTQQTSDRLNLFKVEGQEPQLLQTSVKVASGVSNGDTLYLVRGPI